MPSPADKTVEPVSGTPEFLALGAWDVAGGVHEVVSRRRLDTRQIVPYFVHDGALHVGVLERTRASRVLRGAEVVGLEAIGFDLAGVDETADLQSYGDAIFTARARVAVDPAALEVPLPSYARSIGYLTELSLPLLVGIAAPPARAIDVAWDGGHHRVVFHPLAALRAALDAPDAPPRSEDLAILLAALAPNDVRARTGTAVAPPHEATGVYTEATARALLARESTRVWTAAVLEAFVERAADARGYQRRADPRGADLRFLELQRVAYDGHWFEVVRPGSGVSVAILAYFFAGARAYFLLWREVRVAALERRARQPLYELPMQPECVNATACFVPAREAGALAGVGHAEAMAALVPRLLARALGHAVGVIRVQALGPAAEPCASVSAEVRYRVACEVHPGSLTALPADVFVIAADELARAVADGSVHDPVVVSGLLALGPALGLDPFAAVRTREVAPRRAFLDAMTHGSVVQRRLRSYSSIEAEQLEAPTYARLMTFLQHEYGVRVAYPKSEGDRSFFKAAFRVFMAAGREENRALQGLHWSHDAYHFALGNFTPSPPSPADFAEWYAGGAGVPDVAPAGPVFEAYTAALKAAEDEATFFSFWTLYSEKLSLARVVGKLTFYEALRDMGVTARADARAVFDAVTTRAELPDAVRAHAVYQSRAEVRGLFEYMLGFRDYHLKDITTAWKYAVKDPYRSYWVRFGIYDHDAERYKTYVRGFQRSLERYPTGLNPLLAQCADVKVALALRVWDVVKAMKLVRAAVGGLASESPEARAARRRGFLGVAEGLVREAEACQGALGALRERVTNPEMTPRNEAVFAEVGALGAGLEALRGRIRDAAGATGLLADAVLAEERERELPR